MAALRTSLVKRRHAWTGLDVPWAIDVADESVQSLSAEHRDGWRLFHYLSGGGMKAFATSITRELVSRRQTRFLWVAAALACMWLVFRHV